jgi:hypothetical protein
MMVYPAQTMTTIEQALFRNGSAHCVAVFELAGEAIAVVLHPWEQPELQTRARFEGVKVLSVDDSHADAGAGLPWDIIGFDSEALVGNRWRFCLHTDAIEYCFEAGWPAVERPG